MRLPDLWGIFLLYVDARRRHRGAAIAAVLLLVVAGMVGGLIGKARSEVVYESGAVVMVLPPGAGNRDAKLNPFVNLDNNMIQLALAVTTALNSAQTVTDLGSPDPSITEYTAETVKTSTATAGSGDTVQVRITVRGTDGEIARSTVGSLVEYSRTILRRMQTVAGVKGATFADEVVIVPPTPPETVAASTFRAVVTHAMIGVALAALVIAAVGGVAAAVGRARRGRARADADADPATEPSPERRTNGSDVAPEGSTWVTDPMAGAPADSPGQRRAVGDPPEFDRRSPGPIAAVADDDTDRMEVGRTGDAASSADPTSGPRPSMRTEDHDDATDSDSAASGPRP